MNNQVKDDKWIKTPTFEEHEKKMITALEDAVFKMADFTNLFKLFVRRMKDEKEEKKNN